MFDFVNAETRVSRFVCRFLLNACRDAFVPVAAIELEPKLVSLVQADEATARIDRPMSRKGELFQGAAHFQSRLEPFPGVWIDRLLNHPDDSIWNIGRKVRGSQQRPRRKRGFIVGLAKKIKLRPKGAETSKQAKEG